MCKKSLERYGKLRNVFGGHLPDDLEIHVSVVMCDDVAHATHPSEGKVWYRSAGGFRKVRCCFPDDLDPTNYRILLLPIDVERCCCRVLDVGSDEPGRLKDIVPSTELVSFHRFERLSVECAGARGSCGSSPGSGVRQSPPARPRSPRPRLPFQEDPRSIPTPTRRKSPASLRRCPPRLGTLQQNRTRPNGRCGASHKKPLGARANSQGKAVLTSLPFGKRICVGRCVQATNAAFPGWIVHARLSIPSGRGYRARPDCRPSARPRRA